MAVYSLTLNAALTSWPGYPDETEPQVYWGLVDVSASKVLATFGTYRNVVAPFDNSNGFSVVAPLTVSITGQTLSPTTIDVTLSDTNGTLTPGHTYELDMEYRNDAGSMANCLYTARFTGAVPTPVCPPVTASITANPNPANLDGTTLISWETTGADTASETGPGLAANTLGGSQEVTIDPGPWEVPVVMEWSDSEGPPGAVYLFEGEQVDGAIVEGPVTITGMPSSVVSNGPGVPSTPASFEVTLTFDRSTPSGSIGQSVLLYQFPGTSRVGYRGNFTLPDGEATYTIEASNACGNSASASVTVKPPSGYPGKPPTIDLTAIPNPTKRRWPGKAISVLHWESIGADTVDIEPGIGNVALSGDQGIAMDESTEYTATATNGYGTASTQVIAEVETRPWRMPGARTGLPI